MNKFVILTVFALIFAVSGVSAQEIEVTSHSDTLPVPELISVEDSSADDSVEQDEDVTAEDLGTEEPSLLPDSNFYFLKNWGHTVRSFFTFNPVK